MKLEGCSYLTRHERPCAIFLHAGVEMTRPYLCLDVHPVRSAEPLAVYVIGSRNLARLRDLIDAMLKTPVAILEQQNE